MLYMFVGGGWQRSPAKSVPAKSVPAKSVPAKSVPAVEKLQT